MPSPVILESVKLTMNTIHHATRFLETESHYGACKKLALKSGSSCLSLWSAGICHHIWLLFNKFTGDMVL